MIIRDDDVPQVTSIEKFEEINNEFIRYDKIHTMSILASQLSMRTDFVDWVLGQNNVNFALHGWNHVAYAELSDDKIKEHIEMSLEAFDEYLHFVPTDWYLPWNGWTKELEFRGVPRIKKIAKSYNLRVNEKCEYIGKVVKNNIKSEVVYFHHWDDRDLPLLKKLLEENAKHI
jgi:peptidoglycan/xylan/chitin deacetylase (PgdA/CDA1 family)